MRQVLIIDDSEGSQKIWAKCVPDETCKVSSALTLLQAEEMFASRKDWDLILVDGCVEDTNKELDTVPLVRKMRETFKGDMVAISGRPDFREALMNEGCNLGCDKMDVGKFLSERYP